MRIQGFRMDVCRPVIEGALIDRFGFDVELLYQRTRQDCDCLNSRCAGMTSKEPRLVLWQGSRALWSYDS